MPTEPRGRGEGWVVAQMLLLLAILGAPPELGGLERLPGWVRIPGLLLGLLGGVIGVLGIRALGTNLTAFPRPKDDAELVEHGIYGVVRHPIYSGLVVAATGYALLRTSIPSLILSLVLGVFFDQKARREERWLEARYPGYGDYCRRVRGRIIPR